MPSIQTQVLRYLPVRDRLPDGVGLYDDRISEGYVGVSVLVREHRIPDAQIALEEATPIDILSNEGSLLNAPGVT